MVRFIVSCVALAMVAGCSGNSGPGDAGGGSGGGTAGSAGGGTGGGTGGTGGGSSVTLQTIAVTPAAPRLDAGQTQAFTATGTYSDSSMQDVTATAQWVSTAPAIASVTAAGVATALFPGTTGIRASVGSVSGSTSLTVDGDAVVDIAVAPATANLGVGAAQPYTAIGFYANDAGSQNVTALVTWASTMPAVASITSAGVASALTVGATTITATLGPVTGSTALTVTAKTIRSISVTPAFVSITTAGSQQLTATATYSDGSTHDVSATATWASVTPAAASVSTTGLVSGAMAQSGVGITATAGGVGGKAVVSVTSTSFPLTSISLTPQTMWVGQHFPYPMVSADFGGIGSNYDFVSWVSSNPAVAVADASGLQALTVGVTTLTATTGTLMASNTLTVTAPPLSSIALVPLTPRLAQGSSLKLTATGVYPDTNLDKDVSSSVTWASSNPAVITIDATGLARAVGAGTSTLSATSGAVVGSTVATVPSVTPPQSTVMLAAVNDNTIMYSSLTPSRQTTVFPVYAMFNTPAIAVGCAWLYSPPIGFAPERIDPVCSQALIKFDLGALSGKTILSATLRLRTSVYGVGFVPRQWFIDALASPWSGSSVTWDSASSFQHYVYSQSTYNPPTFSGQVFDLDQTTTVRNWVSGSYLNAGWELGLSNVLFPALSSSSLDQFEFYSSEDPAGRGPQLSVTYQ